MGIFPSHISAKPAEAAKYFEQSIEGFFKVFNASPGGMCLMDERSVLVEINYTYLDFFGFSREELIGHTNEELGIVHSDELRRLKELTKTKGTLKNEEVQCHNKAGKTKYCLITTMPVVFGNKNLMLASFTDVTQMREQNMIISEQHSALYDSITYSRRIQEALFPPPSVLQKHFPESFLLLKPKAIVTGDFYWIEKIKDKIYIAAADCTGHGVPGALMSVIGYNIISKSVSEAGSSRPCDILNKLSRGIFSTLRQHSNSEGIKDGMDISVICIDEKNLTLEFAAARQPVYRVRGNELLRLSPDRFPIGIYSGQFLQEFNNQQIVLQRGDCIYLFTDGYTNQFGGAEKKKFKSMQFQKLLLSIQDLSMEEQKLVLNKEIEEWKGECEQVDDIMIIGVKIT